jgi:hypothetical protein
MSVEEENMALVRRFEEVVMKGDLDAVDELSDAPMHLLCCHTNRRYIGHKVEAKKPALRIDGRL